MESVLDVGDQWEAERTPKRCAPGGGRTSEEESFQAGGVTRGLALAAGIDNNCGEGLWPFF